jgi:hypothetical protein
MRSPSSGAVVAGLVALLVLGALFLAPSQRELGPSYQLSGHGRYGLAGTAAGLRAAGIAVRERDRPTLDGGGLTLVIAPQGVTHDEAESWIRSLRAGATLVYASLEPDPFTDAIGVEYATGGEVRETAGSEAFPDAAWPAYSYSSVRLPAGASSLYEVSGGDAAAAVVPVGRGSVWLFADPTWLTNEWAVDAALPMLIPIAASAGGNASFDRYHQTGAGHLNVLQYLPGWVSLLVAEAVLAGLAVVLAMARRAGPISPAAEPDPAYLGELAPSLAELYARGRHLDLVTGVLANAVQRERGSRAVRVAGPLARLRGAADVRTAVQAWHDIERS